MSRRRSPWCPTAGPASRRSPTSPSLGYCSRKFKELRYDGRFTPPSLQGQPDLSRDAGGVEWGGGAVDPTSQTYVVNNSYVAQIYQLLTREDYEAQTKDGDA